jgi:hypothetical protein
MINERRTRPNSIKRKPNNQIFRTIQPIKRNKLALAQIRLGQQPIRDLVHVRKKLAIRPFPPIRGKDQKGAICDRGVRDLLFQHMVQEQSVLLHSAFDVFACAVRVARVEECAQVMPDVEFGVEVAGDR